LSVAFTACFVQKIIMMCTSIQNCKKCDKKLEAFFFWENIKLFLKFGKKYSILTSIAIIFYLQLQQTSLGPGDIMWKFGTVISGPLDSLIDLLEPSKTEELDQVNTHISMYNFFLRC
jgi:hypothetical protein